MKVDLALRELHRAETGLAAHLTAMADRHQVEHEIYHVGHDLHAWSEQHIRELSATGRRYGVHLSEQTSRSSTFSALRRRLSTLVGRRLEPSLLLLADLRRLHRVGPACLWTGNWWHRPPKPPRTPICWRWPNAVTRRSCVNCAGPALRIKVLSPHIFTS